MSIAAREEYLKENPHIEQLISPINIGDPFTCGRIQAPTQWKEKLKAIKKAHKGSNINTL